MSDTANDLILTHVQDAVGSVCGQERPQVGERRIALGQLLRRMLSLGK